MVGLVQYFISGCKCGAHSCKSEEELEKHRCSSDGKYVRVAIVGVIYVGTAVGLMETEALAQ